MAVRREDIEIPMPDIVLEMDHVSKKFMKGEIHDSLRDQIPSIARRLFKGGPKESLGKNEFWALKDVCFRVKKGEAVGIIGSNGAGKSTILKLLSGIMRPTEGSLTVNGALSALIEVGAGFHPDLTGRDNIFLNGTILGMRRERIKEKFDEIVEFSGLGDFIDTPVKRYSSGMYARLGFSVAAHVDPDIMLVDEVLSVGDYVFQNKCIDKMKSVLCAGTTIIFVSHNLRAVTDMCDRCILLSHGTVVGEGPAARVVADYLSETENGRKKVHAGEVSISKAFFRGQNGETLQFDSGEKAVFEIDVTARVACEKLSVSIVVLDDNQYSIFDTSTERLNHESFSLEAGETKRITYELNLHLAQGTYRLGCYVFRYDIEKMYDTLIPAATIYVKSDRDVRGAANLYPMVTVG
jgi:lipopolysaccharide transport system ATP-binding protein